MIRITGLKTATVGKAIGIFEILSSHANHMTLFRYVPFFSDPVLKIEPPPIQIFNASFTTLSDFEDVV